MDISLFYDYQYTDNKYFDLALKGCSSGCSNRIAGVAICFVPNIIWPQFESCQELLVVHIFVDSRNLLVKTVDNQSQIPILGNLLGSIPMY